MDRTPHKIINPLSLAEPVGYAHALVVTPGRTVHIGGQSARRSDGVIVGETVVQQFDQALANTVEALRAAGAEPGHVVSMRVYTTAMHAYRVNLKTLGSVYRRYMGRYYPPMSVVGVTDLLDAAALVEVVCAAVVPDMRDADTLDDEAAWSLVEEIDESLVAGRFGDQEPAAEHERAGF
ncbi:enamine deaminase RidA (YjgF/YER057c/UK114 family) [Nocardiopsis sp. Huas11]|uniref:RidA family protein n=1 Tax=Nocardiopsis sp. Huas11 TaxID=2183912 RepID=UPI000EAE0450|nr:RidA family protein [Nocardiopsis sp. Huas11]RKS09623.1 enamine deaminase RidA (YjgF/YER057c/UK114 family) [Nocardiopsis sp. Huas11]